MSEFVVANHILKGPCHQQHDWSKEDQEPRSELAGLFLTAHEHVQCGDYGEHEAGLAALRLCGTIPLCET